jgi:hypothetical protein
MDILKRLRQRSKKLNGFGPDAYDDADLDHKAAEKIENLTSQLAKAKSRLAEAVYAFGLWKIAHKTQWRDDIITALFWTGLFLDRVKGKKRKLPLDLKAYSTETLAEEMERREVSLEKYFQTTRFMLYISFF